MADCNPGPERGASQGGPRRVAARLVVAQALGEMTGSAPIPEISVVSLCRKVGISRATFFARAMPAFAAHCLGAGPTGEEQPCS